MTLERERLGLDPINRAEIDAILRESRKRQKNSQDLVAHTKEL
jgi:hypothetical protein